MLEYALIGGDSMHNNLFKKFCNSIDYNTYNKICGVIGLSDIAVILANDHFFQEYPIINDSIDVATTTTLVLYLYLCFSSGKFNTKDINQIRNLYQEFIKNYNKLNDTFNLNDPIEIQTMFNYLLYNGYLSRDKSFEFTCETARDIHTIQGAEIITGKGVCRHISSTLTDILNNRDINASNLCCLQRESFINVKMLDEEKYSHQELIDWVRNHIINERERNLLYELLNRFEKEGIFSEINYYFKNEKNPIKRMFGNHEICFAEKDNIHYFLDPTQGRIYRLKEGTKNILYDEDDDRIQIKRVTSNLLGGPNNRLEISFNLTKPFYEISLDGEKEMITLTQNICKDNNDIFESFYRENNELYNEISNRLVKVKKNPFIRKAI